MEKQEIAEMDARFAFRVNHPLRHAKDLADVSELSEHVKPLSSDWLDAVQDKVWAPNYHGPDKLSYWELALQKRLLQFGGHAVVLYDEPDAENICTRGQLWYGDEDEIGGRVRYWHGVPCHCHDNSGRYWLKNYQKQDAGKPEIRIATGYALSSDGLWRQHSWCVRRTSRTRIVVESTTPRLAYFGFILTDEESEAFIW